MAELFDALGIRWQLILIQLIGFLIVFFILKSLLFERIYRVLAERAAEEERRRHAIAKAKKEFGAAKAAADQRESELEKQAYEQTQAEVRAGLKRKSDLATAALDKAREEVTAARVKHAAEHDRSLSKIREDVVLLALHLAGRATGRELERDERLHAAAEREVAASIAAHPEIFPRMGRGGKS